MHAAREGVWLPWHFLSLWSATLSVCVCQTDIYWPYGKEPHTTWWASLHCISIWIAPCPTGFWLAEFQVIIIDTYYVDPRHYCLDGLVVFSRMLSMKRGSCYSRSAPWDNAKARNFRKIKSPSASSSSGIVTCWPRDGASLLLYGGGWFPPRHHHLRTRPMSF